MVEVDAQTSPSLRIWQGGMRQECLWSDGITGMEVRLEWEFRRWRHGLPEWNRPILLSRLNLVRCSLKMSPDIYPYCILPPALNLWQYDYLYTRKYLYFIVTCGLNALKSPILHNKNIEQCRVQNGQWLMRFAEEGWLTLGLLSDQHTFFSGISILALICQCKI